MSVIYEAIGRLTVYGLRVRYRRQLRLGAALAVLAGLAIGYALATREVEEG